MKSWVNWMVGWIVIGRGEFEGKPHDERGLSQSTETAILIGGALLIGGLIVSVITGFVKGNLPK